MRTFPTAYVRRARPRFQSVNPYYLPRLVLSQTCTMGVCTPAVDWHVHIRRECTLIRATWDLPSATLSNSGGGDRLHRLGTTSTPGSAVVVRW